MSFQSGVIILGNLTAYHRPIFSVLQKSRRKHPEETKLTNKKIKLSKRKTRKSRIMTYLELEFVVEINNLSYWFCVLFTVELYAIFQVGTNLTKKSQKRSNLSHNITRRISKWKNKRWKIDAWVVMLVWHIISRQGNVDSRLTSVGCILHNHYNDPNNQTGSFLASNCQIHWVIRIKMVITISLDH